MRIAVGSDEVTPLVTGLVAWLESHGHHALLMAEGEQWPEVDPAELETIARIEP